MERRGRWWIAALTMLHLVFGGVAEALEGKRNVIPPGQEQFVLAMLGGSDVLPGGCSLDRVEIQEDRIEVSYACAESNVSVELRHVSEAATGTASTTQFALIPRTRTPEGFMAALASRITASEVGFVWHQAEMPAPPTSAPVAPTAPSPVRWILPLAAMLLAAAAIALRSIEPGDVGIVAGVFAIAAGLRLGFGVWGPFHVNGQGPTWLAAAMSGTDSLRNYGPGYAELFGPIARIRGISPDVAIFAANALLSALIPAVAFAVARLVGVERRGATVAAGVLAIDPILARFGATESYFPLILLLSLCTAVSSLAAMTPTARARRWPMVMLLAAAGLFAAQAARIHPMAWMAVAIAPTVVIATPGIASWRARLWLVAVAGGAVGAVVLATSWSPLMEIARLMREGALMKPQPPGARGLVVGAICAGVAVLAARSSPRRWIIVAAMIPLAVMLATVHNFAAKGVWQASYAHLYLTLPIIALIAFLADAPARARGLGAAVIATPLILSVPMVVDRTTEQLEYAWLVPRIAALPTGCFVAHVSHAGRRSVYLPIYPPHVNLEFVAGDRPEPGLLAEDRCVYYVRSSLCASVDGRAACDAFEAQLVLEPTAQASFPARPSFNDLPYDKADVDCVISKVTGLRP